MLATDNVWVKNWYLFSIDIVHSVIRWLQYLGALCNFINLTKKMTFILDWLMSRVYVDNMNIIQ